MLTTWQTVLLLKVQLHVTEFSDPSTGFGVTQPNSPLHGSTVKFQSVFSKVFAISCKVFTVIHKHQQENMLAWFVYILSKLKYACTLEKKKDHTLLSPDYRSAVRLDSPNFLIKLQLQ